MPYTTDSAAGPRMRPGLDPGEFDRTDRILLGTCAGIWLIALGAAVAATVALRRPRRRPAGIVGQLGHPLAALRRHRDLGCGDHRRSAPSDSRSPRRDVRCRAARPGRPTTGAGATAGDSTRGGDTDREVADLGSRDGRRPDPRRPGLRGSGHAQHVAARATCGRHRPGVAAVRGLDRVCHRHRHGGDRGGDLLDGRRERRSRVGALRAQWPCHAGDAGDPVVLPA